MKVKKLILVFAISLLLSSFFSCDNANEQPAAPKPDGTALIAFENQNVEEQTQSFTLDATTGGQIKGSQGTVIKFLANAFLTLGGDPVTGTVDIKLVEIYKRSSMLLTDRPTVGKMDNGDLATLISGGEFFVSASQNGNLLKPASGYTIIAPTNKTGVANLDMSVFTGKEVCEGDQCKIVWEEEKARGIEVGEFQDAGGVFSAYYAFQSQFCWTNIDRWYNDPRTKTTIFVDVPEGFNNTNCAVFIVYDGEPTALGRFDKYDATTGMFTEHYGLIPIGLEVHIVLVSIIEDKIQYAIHSTTITENHIEVIDAVQSITEEELIALIDDLS